MDFYHMTINQLQKSDYPECFFMDKGQLTKLQMEDILINIIMNPYIIDEENKKKYNIFYSYYKIKISLAIIAKEYNTTNAVISKILKDIIKDLYYAQKDLPNGQAFNIDNNVRNIQLTSLGLDLKQFFRFTKHNIRNINDICKYINSGKKLLALSDMGSRAVRIMIDCKNIYINLPENIRISILKELEDDKYK